MGSGATAANKDWGDEQLSTTAYEGFAIVELFGHVRLAGKVSEADQFGVKMLRVDVPEVDGRPGFTTFKGGAAIYAITPTTEELALHVIRQTRPAPISPYDLPPRTALGPTPPDADFDNDEPGDADR